MRMGSGMMQFSPALRLFNPEHVETGPFAQPGPLPSTPPVETMMSIANVTGSDIGPVNVAGAKTRAFREIFPVFATPALMTQ